LAVLAYGNDLILALALSADNSDDSKEYTGDDGCTDLP
jgi:hypothetical protein